MNSDQEGWLNANGYRLEGDINPNTIPIFVEEQDGSPVFLSGYGCVGGKQRGLLIAEAPPGLWLGGGAVSVVVPQGVVSIPDRRHNGNAGPAAQGWAKYSEGSSLALAAAREFAEELVFYRLGGEGDNLYQPCTEIVPQGIEPKGNVRSLNQALTETAIYGELRHLCWSKNEKDRAWIYVAVWDLRDLPQVHRLRVIWDDDFPNDLHPGSNPRVISLVTKREVGRFEGAQGYLPNNLDLHAVLRDSFPALRGLE